MATKILQITGNLGGGSGVYVGPGDMPEGYNVQIDPSGEAAVIPTKTSQLENDSNFITADDLPEGGSGIIDSSLTLPNVAAEAKATGDRLEAIEYQTVTTEESYEHTDLPEEKTIVIHSDGIWNKAYVNFGENLIPNDGFNKTFPFNGITTTKRGNSYTISGTATSNAVICFTDKTGSYDVPVDSSLIGKTINMYSFADSITGTGLGWSVIFYDSSKAQLSKKSTYVANSKNYNLVSIVVPENTAYMRWYFNVTNGITLNNNVQFVGVVADDVQSISLNGEVTEISNIINTEFSTFPYKSTVNYIVPLNEYIANFAGGDTATYLTPEAFGAVGDGYTDDTEAIMTCLTVASETNQTILMARKYYVSEPIDINYSGLQMIVNDIVYSGTDAAVVIHGQKNTLNIHSIVSSGIGVRFIGDGNVFCCWNTLDINTISSSSHGIEFTAPTTGVYQNTIRFNCINAGGAGCYGICETEVENGSWISECNIYGGQISNCDWAVYNVSGNSKIYGVQVETDVKGGFYLTGGVRIFAPRWAESARDGEYPLLKFACPENPSGIIIDSGVPLSIYDIDLTENVDTFTNALGSTNPLHEGRISELNFPIQPTRIDGDGTSVNTPAIYCTKAYVWGKFLVMTPHMAYRKEIATETFDTRLLGREETTSEIYELSQLPTKFIVNTVNTEIYLHESYCAFGFNEFEVEQANGFTCKIYDKLDNLIFDGTDRGDGVYKFKVYKDAELSTNNGYGLLRRDFLGHYWDVTKENTQELLIKENEGGNFSLVLGGGE